MTSAPPPWACEDERLLASIYRFTHTGCSSLQDSGSIECFLQLWRRLLERLVGQGGMQQRYEDRSDMCCCMWSGAFWSAHTCTVAAPPLPQQDDEREKKPAAQRLWPGLAPADLERLQRAVDGLASACTFGDYGCLLVLLQPGQPDIGPVPGSLAVMLVGLDSWRFDVHR